MRVASITDPGRVRQLNEDSFYVDSGLGLLVAADRMGGHVLPSFISGASMPQQMNTRRGCIENRRRRRGRYTAKAARTHALTASQSRALRWPITLNSER